MKKEIEKLLREQGIDVLWVTGNTFASPEFYYLSGGVQLTQGWVVFRPGHQPILCHSSMEREAASASGLQTVDFNELDIEKLSREFNDPVQVKLEMFARLAMREGLSGKLAVHGTADPGEFFDMLRKLSQRLPQLEIIRDFPSVLQSARLTKDSGEIEMMREVAQHSLKAFRETLEFLRQAHAHGRRILDDHRNPVTVGTLRKAISKSLAEQGLQETNETIISIGREAGIPHASSTDDKELTTGQTVVIDLFPCRKGGGYFFDITRSFLIGEASDEALRLYEDVLAAQEKAFAAVRAGLDGCRLQELVCDHFEALGHPTSRSNPGTQKGYVHSLGHGLGLEVHEYPYLRLQDKPDPLNRLLPGTVFTIEPGLYYPECESGIRIEDVVYLDEEGGLEILAPFEKFPILELEE